ncbi:MAG: 3-hydroxyacyl-ACP dehydratase FabZ family protein [Gilvibacter sp.]
MTVDEIQEALPYSEPFLFVDKLTKVDKDGAEGHYTFPPESYFYKGHFEEFPITPGVILTECMAQIGVVALGIFVYNIDNPGARIKMVNPDPIDVSIALADFDISFKTPVFPGEKVFVTSTIEYYRFYKLKCNVIMHKEDGSIACKGTISGVIFPHSKRK